MSPLIRFLILVCGGWWNGPASPVPIGGVMVDDVDVIKLAIGFLGPVSQTAVLRKTFIFVDATTLDYWTDLHRLCAAS